MAELAKRIRRRVNTVLALESDTGHLRQMHKAFKDNLIADLSEDAFADMFAQTITYGLFTARASRSSGALVADNLADMVPSTNPFLKELLSSFLNAAGRARNRQKRVDFDELGINEVVTVLREVPMDAVLRSFNASKPGDDPVIHFYEDFLKAYDKALRTRRGVFYTPSPVVQFIVRSVDEILKTEFGIEDGLASTITWGEMLVRKPELKLPKFCTADTPFVQVLDPATGTGTFIVEVITQVHAHMVKKWQKLGHTTKTQWQPLWVEYVKQHLLPRLYAFELMMAPYAIAHMKIGLKLAETGYTFPEDGPRVNVFLTNALEPAHPVQAQLESMAPMLAHEAKAANRVKEQLAATVVVGNPPYSVSSWNKNPWSDSLIKVFKTGLTDSESQIQALSNDYIKFIGLAKLSLQKSGAGVLGFITGHGFLHGTQPRVLRKTLSEAFPRISLVDLNGSQKRDNAGAIADESVFEILTGVAITLGRMSAGSRNLGSLQIDVFGTFDMKAAWLTEHSLASLPTSQYAPTSPNFFFRPMMEGLILEAEYNVLPSVANFFGCGHPEVDKEVAWATGFATQQDDIAISFSLSDVRIKMSALRKATSIQELSDKYRVCSTNQWNFTQANEWAMTDSWKSDVCKVDYRPFDQRWSVFNKHVMTIRRREVMQHLGHADSLALVCSRAVNDFEFRHAFVCREKVDKIFLSGKSSTNAYVFPLWNFTEGGNQKPNISKFIVGRLYEAMEIDDVTAASSLTAENVFFYLYGLLYSPAYRQRYASFLRIDFPRMPIPGSLAVFNALAGLGSQLVAWHLLEHPDAIKIEATYASKSGATAWFGKDLALTKVAEKGKALAELTGITGKVFINSTSGFVNVRQPIWQHTIGGYQVLHKWLDDRRKAGRSLSQDDITHWLRIYASLQATQALMLQVDAAIEANGGWPGAFSQNHPPPDAVTLAAEQMVQKDQIKAQKKAATATKKRAAYASPTGARSLFDDLEDMASAAGGPDRPKSRATPAKAAGGKSSGNAVSTDGLNDGQVMCAIRRALTSAGSAGLGRDDLIRSTARELGHARTSPALKVALDVAIRRAVRRGIAANASCVLTLLVKDIDGYDRDHLKAQLLAAIRAMGGTCLKEDAPLLLARFMGFARTGTSINNTVEALVRSLVRAGRLESKAGQLTVTRKKA
ncbi:type ISP restriction/modification enzyme [Rhodoferax antarcticus]|nr:type ISP restriction/modification enzyme [Rhodoferax antarcticus]